MPVLRDIEQEKTTLSLTLNFMFDTESGIGHKVEHTQFETLRQRGATHE